MTFPTVPGVSICISPSALLSIVAVPGIPPSVKAKLPGSMEVDL